MIGWAECTAVERSLEVIRGAWQFRHKRVPAKAPFENRDGGATVAGFLDWFPGVGTAQIVGMLRHARRGVEPG